MKVSEWYTCSSSLPSRRTAPPPHRMPSKLSICMSTAYLTNEFLAARTAFSSTASRPVSTISCARWTRGMHESERLEARKMSTSWSSERSLGLRWCSEERGESWASGEAMALDSSDGPEVLVVEQSNPAQQERLMMAIASQHERSPEAAGGFGLPLATVHKSRILRKRTAILGAAHPLSNLFTYLESL